MYFGPSQSQNSQETADVTPVNTPKKSDEAKLKNDPDSSSCKRVDKSPKPSSKLRQHAPDSADFSHRKVHKMPQDSTGEGSSEPSSKSKQSAQQTIKPESEDSLSLSSSSSDGESLDEEVPSKQKVKELPPPPPTRRGTDLDLHFIPGVNAQSLDLDLTPQSERMIDKVDLNLQDKMIDTNIDHN